jgi:hypothetical protein
MTYNKLIADGWKDTGNRYDIYEIWHKDYDRRMVKINHHTDMVKVVVDYKADFLFDGRCDE